MTGGDSYIQLRAYLVVSRCEEVLAKIGPKIAAADAQRAADLDARVALLNGRWYRRWGLWPKATRASVLQNTGWGAREDIRQWRREELARTCRRLMRACPAGIDNRTDMMLTISDANAITNALKDRSEK